jgi:hypothetical protein
MHKLTAFASVFALAVSSLSSAALAEEGDEFGPNPRAAIVGQAGQDPQAVCDSTIPSTASGFTATVLNVTAETDITAPVTVNTTLDHSQGDGTPTYSAFGPAYGPAHLHGQSPNIFGYADANVTTYPNTLSFYHTLTTHHDDTIFDCKVSKMAGNPNDTDHQHEVVPPGLQSTGNKTAPTTRTVVDENGLAQSLQTGVPFITHTGATGVDVVVCISPGPKGGTWKAQSGWTGGCSTTLYTVTLNGSTPSASLPH